MAHGRALAQFSLISLPFLALAGCTTIQNPDGSKSSVLGLTQDQAQVVAATTSTFGSLFGPIGTTVGAGIGALALAFAAKKKGEDAGWDARDAHQTTIDAAYDAGKSETSTPAPKTGA